MRQRGNSMSQTTQLEEDAESMNHAELVSEVKSLRQWREDVSRDLAAMRKMFNVLAGTQDDLEADLWDSAQQIPQLVERIDKLEVDVDAAKAFAKTQSVNETPTKKGLAKDLTKQEIVVDAIVGQTISGGAVTCGEVKHMAKPDVRLEHRTILDAWDELLDTWNCFSIQDGEKKKLVADKDDLETPLVRAVADNLSDEKVTEKLNSYLTQKGGK